MIDDFFDSLTSFVRGSNHETLARHQGVHTKRASALRVKAVAAAVCALTLSWASAPASACVSSDVGADHAEAVARSPIVVPEMWDFVQHGAIHVADSPSHHMARVLLEASSHYGCLVMIEGDLAADQRAGEYFDELFAARGMGEPL